MDIKIPHEFHHGHPMLRVGMTVNVHGRPWLVFDSDNNHAHLRPLNGVDRL